ncbi:hypothetical protein [Garicola koreensis]|uniref:hypothetical protein n=1 Tax=Garicola koreensis TaxID=1262554 RepID=UPI0031EC5F34
MAQPFGVGDVVGGRYRITHHVVTSADQDIIFQAVDQVLDREVSVLLASRANAKQVATSAKELATGERASEVQVLDLGLSAERTYLISTMVNPNQLLDLVIPDSAPYVEPYFTDSLGSELFGQSREMQPQTYDDDAEYYARLQADLASAAEPGRRLPGLPRRRPAFLDKVTSEHADPKPQSPLPPPPAPADQSDDSGLSDSESSSASAETEPEHPDQASEESRTPFSLRTDLQLVTADPSADAHDDVLEALYAWAPKEDDGSPDSRPIPQVGAPEPAPAASERSAAQSASDAPIYEQAPSVPIDTLAAGAGSGAAAPTQPARVPGAADPEGEEIIDDPPAEPDATFDPRHSSETQHRHSGSLPPPPPTTDDADSAGGAGTEQDAASFTSLIRAVPPRTSTSFPAPHGSSENRASAEPSEAEEPRGPVKWVSAAVLVILVLIAAIILFIQLS